LLDAYEARIASEDPFLQTADDMSFFIHGDGDFLKMDSEGRLQVSDFIRAHTHVADRIAFVGRGKHFQVWEPERLSDYSADVRARLLRLRQAKLGAAQGEPE
jgi:MraZ protein